MALRIFRPTYLIDELGELGVLPSGAITNIGGTDQTTFTVGGLPVLLGVAVPVTLQDAYNNGAGTIDLITGRPFIVEALNGKRFIIDPATGAITIEGDLSILGDTVIIDKTIQNVDQLNIRMPAATTVGFDLRPDVGITPTVNLLEVRNLNAGLPVFAINAAGDVIVPGTVDGVDLSTFYTAFTNHVNASVSPPKHTAAQISHTPGANIYVTGTDVQAALDSVEVAIAAFSTSGIVLGFEHIQLLASTTWTVNHAGNSKRVQITIWNNSDEQIFADTVMLTSLNQAVITFNTAVSGRAVLMIF